MSQLEEMQAFVAVVETLSITAAAERLGLSKQLVSRRIQALESRLDVRLLNRTTRRIQPTALGHDYAGQVRDILGRIERVEMDVGLQREEARGHLKVSGPLSFTHRCLRDFLPVFLARFPHIDLHYEISDRRVDLLAEGYDMAIRIGELADSTLIARKLCQERMFVCASPDYLEAHGTPQAPAELRQHACLLYGHSPEVTWRFFHEGKPMDITVESQRRFHANNGDLIMDAAVAGLGIGRFPQFIAEAALAEGKLIPILEDYSPPAVPVSIVYPRHRQTSRPVRAMVDSLVEWLNDSHQR